MGYCKGSVEFLSSFLVLLSLDLSELFWRFSTVTDSRIAQWKSGREHYIQNFLCFIFWFYFLVWTRKVLDVGTSVVRNAQV